MVGFLLPALLGIAWEPLARLGSARLVVPALLFAIVPAALALAAALRALPVRLAVPAAAAAVIAPAVVLLTAPERRADPANALQPRALALGLGRERTAVVDALRRHTTPTARVLWEDRRGPRTAPRWAALLPLLTGRPFVGGLDPDLSIEHTASGLADQALVGRPLEDWTDADLDVYCDHYNIGWVVCWTPRARHRFDDYARQGRAEPTTELPDADGGSGGCLFTLRRRHSYALKGSVGGMSADSRRIVLSEVTPEMTPEGGVVELSLRYQTGLRVFPSRVHLDVPKETPENDPVVTLRFVRLRLDEFVPRVTLTWDRR
jgi:hypothetical protein